MLYKQQDIMRPWIEFNTAKRAASKNGFEKDFYKLMNNACFGKTMENVRGRSNFKFASNENQRLLYTARPTFKRNVNIGDPETTRLLGMDMRPTQVTLDKPIFMGASILDLSKHHMFSFHYKTMLPRYGGNIKLCFTDTDSLCYKVTTGDLYADIAEMSDIFDTSDFPKDHPLFSEANKKVIGKFKDECVDGKFAVMSEFVGLRPKMYSFEKVSVADGGCHNKCTAKGIKKYVIKRDLNMAVYKETLEGKGHTVEQVGFRSRNQVITTDKQCKTGLSGVDTKRWICPDGVNTLAHGHYRIPQ